MGYGNGHGTVADREHLENAMRLGESRAQLAETNRRLAEMRVAAFSDPDVIEAARIAAWHQRGEVRIGRVLHENGDVDLRVPDGWPEGVEPEDAVERLLTDRGWSHD